MADDLGPNEAAQVREEYNLVELNGDMPLIEAMAKMRECHDYLLRSHQAKLPGDKPRREEIRACVTLTEIMKLETVIASVTEISPDSSMITPLMALITRKLEEIGNTELIQDYIKRVRKSDPNFELTPENFISMESSDEFMPSDKNKPGIEDYERLINTALEWNDKFADGFKNLVWFYEQPNIKRFTEDLQPDEEKPSIPSIVSEEAIDDFESEMEERGKWKRTVESEILGDASYTDNPNSPNTISLREIGFIINTIETIQPLLRNPQGLMQRYQAVKKDRQGIRDGMAIYLALSQEYKQETRKEILMLLLSGSDPEAERCFRRLSALYPEHAAYAASEVYMLSMGRARDSLIDYATQLGIVNRVIAQLAKLEKHHTQALTVIDYGLASPADKWTKKECMDQKADFTNNIVDSLIKDPSGVAGSIISVGIVSGLLERLVLPSIGSDQRPGCLAALAALREADTEAFETCLKQAAELPYYIDGVRMLQGYLSDGAVDTTPLIRTLQKLRSHLENVEEELSPHRMPFFEEWRKADEKKYKEQGDLGLEYMGLARAYFTLTRIEECSGLIVQEQRESLRDATDECYMAAEWALYDTYTFAEDNTKEKAKAQLHRYLLDGIQKEPGSKPKVDITPEGEIEVSLSKKTGADVDLTSKEIEIQEMCIRHGLDQAAELEAMKKRIAEIEERILKEILTPEDATTIRGYIKPGYEDLMDRMSVLLDPTKTQESPGSSHAGPTTPGTYHLFPLEGHLPAEFRTGKDPDTGLRSGPNRRMPGHSGRRYEFGLPSSSSWGRSPITPAPVATDLERINTTWRIVRKNEEDRFAGGDWIGKALTIVLPEKIALEKSGFEAKRKNEREAAIKNLLEACELLNKISSLHDLVPVSVAGDHMMGARDHMDDPSTLQDILSGMSTLLELDPFIDEYAAVSDMESSSVRDLIGGQRELWNIGNWRTNFVPNAGIEHLINPDFGFTDEFFGAYLEDELVKTYGERNARKIWHNLDRCLVDVVITHERIHGLDQVVSTDGKGVRQDTGMRLVGEGTDLLRTKKIFENRLEKAIKSDNSQMIAHIRSCLMLIDSFMWLQDEDICKLPPISPKMSAEIDTSRTEVDGRRIEDHTLDVAVYKPRDLPFDIGYTRMCQDEWEVEAMIEEFNQAVLYFDGTPEGFWKIAAPVARIYLSFESYIPGRSMVDGVDMHERSLEALIAVLGELRQLEETGVLDLSRIVSIEDIVKADSMAEWIMDYAASINQG